MPRSIVAELCVQRADLIQKGDALLKRAENAKRDLFPDEIKKFDALELQAQRLAARIEIEGGIPRNTLPHPESEVVVPRGFEMPAHRRRGELGREQRMVDHVPVDESLLSREDATQFSLGRAIRGMVTGRWDDADLEHRAVQESVNTSGGFLTPEVLGTVLVDRIRNQARVLQAGATVVPVASDQHSIPRLTAGVTGNWRAENAPVTEESPTFDRITFQVKSLATLVKCSYELLQDAIPAALDGIAHEIIESLGLAVDLAALRGPGTGNQPLGIRNQTGVTIQSLGVNGAAPTSWDVLVNAVSAVQQLNLQPNAAIMAPRTAKEFAILKDSTGQPLEPPMLLDGVDQLYSNQIPINLTQGGASTASEIYVADWSHLLIGVRPSISVQIQNLRERFADSMQVGILAFLRADIQLRHPEAFCCVTGVL